MLEDWGNIQLFGVRMVINFHEDSGQDFGAFFLNARLLADIDKIYKK
jgi:hypothetical protein